MILFLAYIGAMALFFLGCMGLGALVVLAMGRPDNDETWCGCDGAGMAHLAGAKGFACEDDD